VQAKVGAPSCLFSKSRRWIGVSHSAWPAGIRPMHGLVAARRIASARFSRTMIMCGGIRFVERRVPALPGGADRLRRPMVRCPSRRQSAGSVVRGLALLRHRHVVSGGSTITMQVARNHSSDTPTVAGKLIQIAAGALQIETPITRRTRSTL